MTQEARNPLSARTAVDRCGLPLRRVDDFRDHPEHRHAPLGHDLGSVKA